MNQKLSEKELFFYEDKICGEADPVFRIAYGMTLNMEGALDLLKTVFKQAAMQATPMMNMSEDDIRLALYRLTYEHADGDVSTGNKSPVQESLSKLSRPARMYALLRYLLCLEEDEITELLDFETEECHKNARLAKDAILSQFSGDEKVATGQFQLALHSFYLSESQKASLHDIVEDAEVRKTRELKRIDQFGKFSQYIDFRRRLLFILLFATIVFALVYTYSPDPSTMFRPLEALSYEALALEESDGSRIDLPSSSQSEIANFIATDKLLSFSPLLPKKAPRGWVFSGASIIDYEVKKIVTIELLNRDLGEKMYYFNYGGDLSNLPPSDIGNFEGFLYRTYDSESFNIVCWQNEGNSVGMFVGRRSAEELASYAKESF